MSTSPEDALTEIRRTLTNWRATHPEATFLEMEEAVELRFHRLRASLLAERAEKTIVRECTAWRECGTRMEPRTSSDRRIVLGGDETVEVHRFYSVCPAFGWGLSPPHR